MQRAYSKSTAFAFFAVQLFAIAVLLFGDIGFDRPGRFGLSFDHYVLLLMLYGAAAIGGTFYTFTRGRWKLALIQVLIPLFAVIGTVGFALFSIWLR